MWLAPFLLLTMPKRLVRACGLGAGDQEGFVSCHGQSKSNASGLADCSPISSVLDFLIRLPGTDRPLPVWITSGLPTIRRESRQALDCGRTAESQSNCQLCRQPLPNGITSELPVIVRSTAIQPGKRLNIVIIACANGGKESS